MKRINLIKYRTPKDVSSNLYWTLMRLKYYMGAIEINVAQHCNLNCAGCTHYSPISEKKFADVNEFAKNINLLAKKLPHPWIREIRLLGGEPLLHKDINKFIDVARKAYPKARITIVTNGLLLLKMNLEFFECVKTNQAKIRITKYPIDFDYDKTIAYLTSLDVNHDFYKEILETGFTYDLLDVNGPYNAKKNFKKCRQNFCMQLDKDKIFICPYNAFCEILNNRYLADSDKKFVIDKKDYIKISNIKSPLTFVRFILSYKPFCRYCALDKNTVHEWRATEFNNNEWMV